MTCNCIIFMPQFHNNNAITEPWATVMYMYIVVYMCVYVLMGNCCYPYVIVYSLHVCSSKDDTTMTQPWHNQDTLVVLHNLIISWHLPHNNDLDWLIEMVSRIKSLLNGIWVNAYCDCNLRESSRIRGEITAEGVQRVRLHLSFVPCKSIAVSRVHGQWHSRLCLD